MALRNDPAPVDLCARTCLSDDDGAHVERSFRKRNCRQLGNEPRGIFGHNLAKAEHILASRNGIAIDPATAPKTWAFWQNLWHPHDPQPVTLDSWMFRAHGLPDSTRLGTYQALADAYRAVAAELDLIPNQLQAIVWLHIKQRSAPTTQENARKRP